MKSRTAFTIIEVMVALMIFSMAAVALGSAYLNVLNSYEVVAKGFGDDRELAYARSQVLTQPSLTAVQAGGEYDAPEDDDSGAMKHVSWTADVEPTNTTDLFTVTITTMIAHSLTGSSKTHTQTFMLLRPTWSDPTDRTTLRQAAIQRIEQAQGKAQK